MFNGACISTHLSPIVPKWHITSHFPPPPVIPYWLLSNPISAFNSLLYMMCAIPFVIRFRTIFDAWHQNYGSLVHAPQILWPCSHSQLYPTREPFANGTRRVAVYTLRPLRRVRPVESDHIGRVGFCSDAPSAHVCRMTYFFPLH